MSEQQRVILVVDDDQSLLVMLSECLSQAGYLSILATNGIEGLKKLEAENPQLVVLDVNMPELDGMQTCRLIRANQKFQRLPILMLTGRGDIKDMLEARRMGADDYLVKPFDPGTLMQKIERLFQR
jgi:Response regulators consisting of a CheY-like receiver domain and a winged-helix DNA-binding domain